MTRRTVRPVPPNWFAVVMGTSIVATSAHSLPWQLPGLGALAWTAWAAAGLALAVAVIATVRHVLSDRGAVRAYLLDGAVAPFYGALSMGLLAYGAATLLVAGPALGASAIAIDSVLWTVGTMVGLATAVGVPVLHFTRHETAADSASGAWLMPVVPPMVSAATGALLLPSLHGAAAQTLALACYAMVGAAGLASLALLPQIWSRLAHHKLGAAAAVPTLWIVLGPLGQSVTAIGLLADHAGPALGVEPEVLRVGAVLVSVPVLGFALLWLAIAGVLTARTARTGLPFSLAWWAFTFPVGTCVTGASSLAAHTDSSALAAIAVGLFALLLGGWLVAARGTVRDLVARRAQPAVSARLSRATQPGPRYTNAV
ncbi:TDT family transporter [Demequina sp. SYSU T00039]|uniref:TDT family transporter n=1 Tax=Demequina lignilytica TaxID=3051663 RepID=A0AAW7M1W2_9MICO|nr:TDT family transporter [Demequina sp. SYSU T00039]MDN4486835.1 TDT family transporter [Demequina sp. SYSU T00039]